MHARGLIVPSIALFAPLLGQAQIGGVTIQPGRGDNVSRVGTRAANFLEIGVGGRGLALAGAYVASATDVSATYWNVAGLAEVTKPSLFLSRERLYGASGLTNSYVAASVPLFGGSFGISFTDFSSGDIRRTTEAFPEGNDPVAGAFVSWDATAIGVHYARIITDRLDFGVTGKHASEGIQFGTASYNGADAGVRFRSGLYGTTLGASLANIGSSGRITGPATQRTCPPRRDPQFPTQRTINCDLRPGSNQLPTMIRFGIETDLVGGAEALVSPSSPNRLALLADVTDGIDTNIMPAFAAELGYHHTLFLRAGKRFLSDHRTASSFSDGLAAGLGLVVPLYGRRVLVDYAYRNFGDLGNNQAFSFQFDF
ncbi:MAG: PorV/PorQ family protein [Gemmatimonadaceae bacterium]